MSEQAAARIAVAVVAHAGHYLIGLRSPGAPLAGCWEFAGGKLLPGEAPRAGAVRECREETGLAVEAVGEYPSVEHEYSHGRLKIYFVQCRLLERHLIEAGADANLPPRFRWVPRESLDQYTFPPANSAVLEAIARE